MSPELCFIQTLGSEVLFHWHMYCTLIWKTTGLEYLQ